MESIHPSSHNRRPGIRVLAVLLLLQILACALPCTAQGNSVEPRISLVTCSPGKEIYQLEGHEALRIEMPGGIDLAVNWGVFDFAAPNFVYRFVKGETDYMAAAYPFNIFLEEYRREGRRVTEQELNLTPEQKEKLIALVEENLQTDNRTYRYNYVKDNCSTRPLALVERASGGEIILHDSIPANTTFRSEMTSYHANYPWYQFGIDIALGAGIDYPISARERTFAPVWLEKALSEAEFRYPGGDSVPVVKSTRILLEETPGGVIENPTPWPLTPFAAGIYLLVITLAISIYDIRRKRLSRWFDSTLFGIQFLAGCLLTFLIFVSVHEATSPNWLYLWLNPLCIIPAAGIWIKKLNRAVYWYQICNFAALILLLTAHHYFGQALNAAFPLYIWCTLTRSATDIYTLRTHGKKSRC